MLLYKLTRSFVGTPNGVSVCVNSGRAVARPYDNCLIKKLKIIIRPQPCRKTFAKRANLHGLLGVQRCPTQAMM
jgi:hypothetical protein